MNTLRNDLIKAALTGLCANPNFSKMEHADLALKAIDISDTVLGIALNTEPESPITGSAEVDWSQAPEEANWHAWDEDSVGYYYDNRPVDYQGFWKKRPGSMYWVSNLPKPANLAARDSLTRRPGKCQ
jgi:hypothetical protein